MALDSIPWEVTEDLSTLINAMSPRPDTIVDLQQAIQDRHGISVSDEQVRRALKLVLNPPSFPVVSH